MKKIIWSVVVSSSVVMIAPIDIRGAEGALPTVPPNPTPAQTVAPAAQAPVAKQETQPTPPLQPSTNPAPQTPSTPPPLPQSTPVQPAQNTMPAETPKPAEAPKVEQPLPSANVQTPPQDIPVPPTPSLIKNTPASVQANDFQEKLPLPTPTATEEDQDGPDTFKLSSDQIGFRGNWVKKREWLLRAKELNKKIQDIVVACQEQRAPFFETFDAIQKELDAFYKEIEKRIGNIQGSLTNLLGADQLIENVTQELSPAARKAATENLPTFEEFDDATKLKRYLADIEKELEPIKTLAGALSKRIKKLDQELTTVSHQGQKSQELYEAIWDIVDDTKAQANFFELKNISRTLKSIRDYISGEFSQDFNVTIETTKKQLEIFKEKLLENEVLLKTFENAERDKQRKALMKKIASQQEPWYRAYPKLIWRMGSEIIASGVNVFTSLYHKITGQTPAKALPPRTAREEQKPQEVLPIAP